MILSLYPKHMKFKQIKIELNHIVFNYVTIISLFTQRLPHQQRHHNNMKMPNVH